MASLKGREAMRMRHQHRRTGFTLTELIVVMAIIAMIAAVSIPGLRMMGVLSRNELPETTRMLDMKLRAARMYAAANNVNTALVYRLAPYDPNYKDPERVALAPDDVVRVFKSVSLAYQLSVDVDAERRWMFLESTPENGDIGQFTDLPDNLAILLQSIDPNPVPPLTKYYRIYFSTFVPVDDPGTTPREDLLLSGCLDPAAPINNLNSLGMQAIKLLLDWVPGETIDTVNIEGTFAAHVFTPSGRLEPPAGVTTERIRMNVGYEPTFSGEPRFDELDTAIAGNEWVASAIDIFRSSGRIQVAPFNERTFP